MPEEARLIPREGGLVPEGDGWFVINAREARWWRPSSLNRIPARANNANALSCNLPFAIAIVIIKLPKLFVPALR